MNWLLRFKRIPILGPCIWKRYFYRSLTLGRASHMVLRSGNPLQHIELCAELEKIDLGLPSNAFVRLGSYAPAARACLRQRLVATAVYPYLLRELMCAVAKPGTPVTITAPFVWQQALASHGIHVRTESRQRWSMLLMLLWAQGMYAAVIRLWGICRSRVPSAPTEPHAILMNMTRSTIPSGEASGFDFTSWYLSSTARGADISKVWAHFARRPAPTAGSSVIVVTDYLPALRGVYRKSQFLWALLWMVLTVTVRGLAGQWWEIVMLEQLVNYLYALHVSGGDFARAYIFNNAWFIVRPMWTYVAEEAGSRIDLVFYGTNIELFVPGGARVPPALPGYGGMTWQHYFVWDEIQAEFLKKLNVTARPVVVGPTGFADTATRWESCAKPYVVVFDVTPQRPLIFAQRGAPHPYYNDIVWWQFMNHVHTALSDARFSMVYKKKREIGRVATARSRRTIEQWSVRNEMHAVDPEIAPQRLIAEAAGVISMPFTSTALIARSMGKPTIYYDPLGTLVKEQRLAHGVDVIGNRADLRAWLASLSKQQMLRQPVS